MNFQITHGAGTSLVPRRHVLVALLDGRMVASAAKLPGGPEEERWLILAASTPERAVHRDEDGYTLVLGEPAARAALEDIAKEASC